MNSGDELLDNEDLDLPVVSWIAMPEFAVSFGKGLDPLLSFRRQTQALLDRFIHQPVEIVSALQLP